MKLPVKIIGGLAVVATSFVTTLWLMDRNFETCPPGRTVALLPPFAKYSGVAFIKEVRSRIDSASDSPEAPRRSRLLICENGNLFGSPHTVHVDIAENGRGRYSHWGSDLIFSTSDNSDPNTNGRNYVAVEPR